MMTPVNLFTGVLSCGLICVLTVWMDRRWLPRGIASAHVADRVQPAGGILFLALGLKGDWDNENRLIAFGGMTALFAAAVLIAMSAGSSSSRCNHRLRRLRENRRHETMSTGG